MLKPGNIKISYTKLPRLAATTKKEKNIHFYCSFFGGGGRILVNLKKWKVTNRWFHICIVKTFSRVPYLEFSGEGGHWESA